MATLPKATTVVDDTAGPLAGGLDVVCMFAPVPTSADETPRLFGSAKAIFDVHGFSDGVEYAALHADQVAKPILFVGLPIVTAGAISRENTSGNSGSSVTTLAAGGDGVLGEHDGVVTVATGGTIGTDQIVLTVSLDGGRTSKRVKMGAGNTHTPLYFNVTISFAAGTLVTGDTIHTWHGSAPLSDNAGWTAARIALAAQEKSFRSTLLIGDLQDNTEAAQFTAQMNTYETANERFIYGRASVYDREPIATMAQISRGMTGAPNITFAEVGATSDTITRSAGSFVTDGFLVGDIITIAGSSLNNLTTAATITGVTATVITLDDDDLVDEGPVAGVSITGTPSLTFAEVGGTGDTITRSSGSWLTDGFRVADKIDVTGSVSNNITGAAGITAVTATVITFDTDDLAAEVIGSSGVSVTAGQTKAEWMAEIDAAFTLDAEFRIDLSAGRARITSPFTGWLLRRPAAWFASLREYQNDLHITTWRKADGPTGASLKDADNNIVEWDDRVDGSAGSAARFTTMRSWANGPQGAFITLSLTREEEGSLLSETHNVAVTNLACTVVQLNTENIIGESVLLNDDGTATSDALSDIKERVQGPVNLALLTDTRNQGPRASAADWNPSTDDILNVPGATLTGVLIINLNGTIHNVNTSVRVVSGG